MIKTCKICQKDFETKNPDCKYCSSHCSNVAHWKEKNPIIKIFYEVKSVKEIPKNKLKELHNIDLYVISNMLKRHNLNFLNEEYREFRRTIKLCKNCNEFYPSEKRSGSKCPNPGCFAYNKERWAAGVEKNKKIKLEKYGNPHYTNIEKQKQTNIERYGVENPLKCPQILEKRKQTNIERYGGICPTKSPKVIEKAKQTNLKKYGVINPFMRPEVQAKQKQTFLERYGVPGPNYINYTNFENFNPDFIVKNFVKDGYLQEEAAREYFNAKTIKPILNCLDLVDVNYKREPKGCRAQRKFFWDYLKEHDVKIIYEKPLCGYRVDGFIAPNTIIEFLGDYWHGKSNDDYIVKQLNQTAKELYEQTFSRFQKLKDAGFVIYYIWESDYAKNGLRSLQNF